MSTFLQNNPRVLSLVVGLILVAGSVAFTLLPRMEDPRLTPRVARVTTILPGADAMRVDALVTEKLEETLREIEDVKQIRSNSSANVSVIVIELNDAINESEAANIWSRVRSKLDDARAALPPESQAPDFEQLQISASAIIVGLRWDLPDAPNFGILRRLAKQLKDRIDSLPGTEKSELVGAPEEEILVTINTEAVTSLGLSPQNIARAVAASDAKVSAGLMRSSSRNLQMEVAGELDTLQRIGQIPVQFGTDASSFVELGDVAKIEKTVRTPVEAKVLLDDRPSVALAVQMQPNVRLDRWMGSVNELLESFEAQLPFGIQLERVFAQNKYVNTRMWSLASSLLYGAAAIAVVIFVMMGWRSALIVGAALPLVSLMVLACMHWLKIPIHQMSITGLIIALGLMIDNAIVVVDEIAQRIRSGRSRDEAVQRSLRFLLMPLLGSTITTTLSFSPIILMEGPSGEFVGAIAMVAVLAVVCSFVLAITVIAAFAGLGLSLPRPDATTNGPDRWTRSGFSMPSLTTRYSRFIRFTLRRPVLGIAGSLLLPLAGFALATQLPEQFFPPSERAQFHVELELPASSSIEETARMATLVRQQLLEDPRIKRVQWFLGESAPKFYYNVIAQRTNRPQYGQAIVDCVEGVNITNLLREKQALMDHSFPSATLLARQLEQGPPFDAPVELRVKGPDTKTLRQLGDQLRLMLIQLPRVHHTRASLSESAPKISLVVDEAQARLAGLNYRSIANTLNSNLEGITGGSILEATEELPVRVRVAPERRDDIRSIASLDLLVSQQNTSNTLNTLNTATRGAANSRYSGLPLSAISNVRLTAETVQVQRIDGQRLNEVQAFIDAGVLPALVMKEFRSRLNESDFRLPAGYSLSFGGAEEERNEAVRSLIGNMFVIVALMITALVVSMQSFRLAGLLMTVAGLSIGLGLGSLWLAGHPWGFMSMVAMMGMIGVAVNDSIVVLAAIRELPPERSHHIADVSERIVTATRHILSTTLTTIFGFLPLFLFGGDFWSPVATAISGGVGGATILALVFVPCVYMLVMRPHRVSRTDVEQRPDEWNEPLEASTTERAHAARPRPAR